MASGFTVAGLVLSFAGAVVLLGYSIRTDGATTQADRDFLAPRWVYKAGYLLLAAGFLGQIVGASL